MNLILSDIRQRYTIIISIFITLHLVYVSSQQMEENKGINKVLDELIEQAERSNKKAVEAKKSQNNSRIIYLRNNNASYPYNKVNEDKSETQNLFEHFDKTSSTPVITIPSSIEEVVLEIQRNQENAQYNKTPEYSKEEWIIDIEENNDEAHSQTEVNKKNIYKDISRAATASLEVISDEVKEHPTSDLTDNNFYYNNSEKEGETLHHQSPSDKVTEENFYYNNNEKEKESIHYPSDKVTKESFYYNNSEKEKESIHHHHSHNRSDNQIKGRNDDDTTTNMYDKLKKLIEQILIMQGIRNVDLDRRTKKKKPISRSSQLEAHTTTNPLMDHYKKFVRNNPILRRVDHHIDRPNLQIPSPIVPLQEPHIGNAASIGWNRLAPLVTNDAEGYRWKVSNGLQYLLARRNDASRIRHVPLISDLVNKMMMRFIYRPLYNSYVYY